ncbi:hypothetical protein [Vibrio fluvialis]|uniref:hypothetical protein n=1 Tax=Vibrio fluvialis TaxID=676 RepID=UPI0028DF6139|nr:hypothetical protein [Vibrio fluvialis]MDT8868277.1 hypothetical protein [Vibrio fluvialis]MDT8875720.1 hypothetical protein [Vibrio fluvialis]
MGDDGVTEKKRYAVDMMVEATKQLIAISTAFILVTVSFIQFLIPDFKNISSCSMWLISITWAFLVFSILCGIISLGGIAYSAYEKNKYDLSNNSIKYPMCFQQLLFLLAVISFIFFAISTIKSQSLNIPTENIQAKELKSCIEKLL